MENKIKGAEDGRRTAGRKLAKALPQWVQLRIPQKR